MSKDFIFDTTVKLFPFEEVSRWIPYPTQPLVIEDLLANFALYSSVIPTEERQFVYLQAAVREYFRKQDSKEPLTGGKSFLPKYVEDYSRNEKEALLIFLDTQEPQGVVEVYGRKKTQETHFATIIAPLGPINPLKKEKILTADFDFKIKEKQRLVLVSDEIQLIPLPFGERVKVKVRCFSNFKITGKSSLQIELLGSRLGVIFDGRGRPMNLPTADPQGRERLLLWQNSLGLSLKF